MGILVPLPRPLRGGELGLSESVRTNITPPECRKKINNIVVSQGEVDVDHALDVLHVPVRYW